MYFKALLKYYKLLYNKGFDYWSSLYKRGNDGVYNF